MCLLCCADQALEFANVDGDLVPLLTGFPVADALDDNGTVTAAEGTSGQGGLSPSATVSEGGDVASSTSTSAVINLGDRFNGTVETGSDRDWIRVELVAGESYVFNAWGTGGTAAGLNDTVLDLRDAAGGLLISNDDVVPGSNSFSQISYTATVSGAYYLDVGSWGGESGSYSVMASTNVFSVEEIALQLTEYGWGVPVPLRHDERAGDIMTVNITGLTAEGQQLALWALEAWANVTGITFTTTGGSADILFDDEESGAFAGPDAFSPNTGTIAAASVNVGTGWLASYGTTLDSYSYQTYVHEIGHALGLYHSGNYNGSATYGVDNHFLNDSYQMTVMSYFSNAENSAVTASNYRLAGPMMADIYAVQSLYGAPTVFSGDTIWGRNTTVGGIQGALMGYLFDGDVADPAIYGNGLMALTIYDSGGTDLIDVSGRGDHQLLDLREGRFSNVAGLTGNLGIALGALIENGTTGSGNDTLIGNGADNLLTGGAGDDVIDGNGGDDTLIVNAARSGATVTDLGGGLYELVSADGTDRFSDVEYFQFTDGTVDLAQLNGGGTPGNDMFVGTTASETFDGGLGNDSLFGDQGFDTLYGGEGRDTLDGGRGADRLYGGADSDFLYGRAGDDGLYDDYGWDRIYGGIGNDTLEGGRGDDRLYAGRDEDVLYGGIGNDRLFGGPGDDQLFGEDGDDSMRGGAGFDTLTGGSGDDTLFGSINADVFVFADGHGVDQIADFHATNDGEKIDLTGVAAITDFADLMTNHISQTGGDVVIDTGSGQSITLLSVNLADLGSADFILG